jgi:hypothetical protein
MISTGTAWRYTGNHDDPDPVSLHHEGVPEHHSKLGSSKWDMCISLPVLLHVQASNALLQSKQTLIYLSPFQPPLPVIALAILSSLAPS